MQHNCEPATSPESTSVPSSAVHRQQGLKISTSRCISFYSLPPLYIYTPWSRFSEIHKRNVPPSSDSPLPSPLLPLAYQLSYQVSPNRQLIFSLLFLLLLLGLGILQEFPVACYVSHNISGCLSGSQTTGGSGKEERRGARGIGLRLAYLMKTSSSGLLALMGGPWVFFALDPLVPRRVRAVMVVRVAMAS